MSGFQAIADRAEIDALRMPSIPVELEAQEEIRAWGAPATAGRS